MEPARKIFSAVGHAHRRRRGNRRTKRYSRAPAVCGPVLLSSHLGLSRAERAAQFRTLDGLFGADGGGPASAAEILMGDFNEWAPWSRRIRALRRGFDACSRARTFPSVLPLFALDRICVRGRGVTVRFGGLRIPVAGRASDRRPVVADVAFGAGGGPGRVRGFRRTTGGADGL